MIILDIAVFATADANWQLAINEYIAGANYQLANYDMRLNENTLDSDRGCLLHKLIHAANYNGDFDA